MVVTMEIGFWSSLVAILFGMVGKRAVRYATGIYDPGLASILITDL
jgi:hypothetical protein